VVLACQIAPIAKIPKAVRTAFRMFNMVFIPPNVACQEIRLR
jgi:hypothetical protein